jgi:lipoyl-dependent peroxiredoxin subunit C
MLTVGDKFPEFELEACVGIEKGKEFAKVRSSDAPGKWKVVYFYPKDFTFICPTEIVEFDKKLKDFADRDAIVIGGSTDNEHSHLAWRQHHKDLTGLRHPLAFFTPAFSAALGVLHKKEGVALRATYIVDPEGIIRSVNVTDLSVGRNVDELLRILDALQTDELCPCNWHKGEKTLS